MPKFKYKIIKKSGANKSGSIEANSAAEAKSKLTSGGDMVTSLSEVSGSAGKRSGKKYKYKIIKISINNLSKYEQTTN